MWFDGWTNGYGMTSGTVVVECQAGEKVWVECEMDGSWIHGNSDYKFNTFSGMLVRPCQGH